ncbi:acylneuraminate cytidylyltransferase [Rhizobium sp. TRM95111]|uniref:acylneuraminate cytidylyltransferase n=1 Tax=Rhizobium alarense TaxID=2846851 RepID=UPI001F169BA1|nr:acylneuraminate cytidylyltransferase [Rhizobium alarense]MCF3640929.1 acylneuraminate cytidylyltransferase [Rhizobium alarense]
MKAVAVIPARGGSVGLPGKNIRPFNGIPLVGRTVLAARQAERVSAAYVSSDSEEILAVAERHGGRAIRRPGDISGSTASSESALLHALDVLAGQGEEPDVLVFLQCTSPFTSAAHVDAVLAAMEEQGADSAFSAVEDHGFIWQIGADGAAEGITHDHTKPRQRRQDMTPRYRENGAIYAMRVPAFRAQGNRFCGRSILVPMDVPTVEIDTPEDWRIAEAIARAGDGQRHRLASRSIKAVVTDFDGVHTDDRVLVGADGDEYVQCSRSDGMGIEHLRKHGLKLLVLSREQNAVVRARAAKLHMEVQHHVLDKLPALDAWRAENGLEWSEIAYIGNDINDLDCMRACGVSFAPADAHVQARGAATVVLAHEGGRGALREMSEILIGEGVLAEG